MPDAGTAGALNGFLGGAFSGVSAARNFSTSTELAQGAVQESLMAGGGLSAGGGAEYVDTHYENIEYFYAKTVFKRDIVRGVEQRRGGIVLETSEPIWFDYRHRSVSRIGAYLPEKEQQRVADVLREWAES